MPKIKNSEEPVSKSFLKFELDRFGNKIEEKLTKFRDQILTAIDPLLSELEQRRLDRELASDQTAQIKEKVDDHEERISKLESPVQAEIHR